MAADHPSYLNKAEGALENEEVRTRHHYAIEWFHVLLFKMPLLLEPVAKSILAYYENVKYAVVGLFREVR